jgi:hypothetical protein
VKNGRAIIDGRFLTIEVLPIMSKAEVLETLQNLTVEENLEVIETASPLLRQNIARPKLSLIQAADQMKSFYEPGSELAQWTDEDPENFQDYQNYA